MSKLLLLALLLTAPATFAADVVALTAEDLAKRPPLSLVPEMELVPELDAFTPTDSTAFAEHAAAFQTEWTKLAPWLSEKFTPAAARALSRWAAPQMEKYTTVPPLDKLTFRPVATLKARGLVVYEVTIDRLPVHHPLVTRQLLAYVCYHPESKSIKRVTITIRGHAEE